MRTRAIHTTEHTQHTLHGRSGGFTLVEAMVAIAVLSFAITGPMLIAQKGIAAAIYARDQVTAFYLAQEAVEYVRNVRDTNRIQQNSWLNGLSNCLPFNGAQQSCRIDAEYLDFTNPSAIQGCASDSGGVCKLLNINTSTGLYGYGSGGSWVATPFRRTITIDNSASPKEAKVSVTVSWSTNLFTPQKSFTVTESIFNF